MSTNSQNFSSGTGNRFPTQPYQFIEQLKQQFWSLTDIYLTMTPALDVHQMDGLSFLTETPTRNFVRSGGRFFADLVNIPSTHRGGEYGDSVKYSSRQLPFGVSPWRDKASSRLEFSADEFDWVIPYQKGQKSRTVDEASKRMVSETARHLVAMKHLAQNTAVNQLKEGSPVFFDLAARSPSSHANEPHIPELISQENLSQVETILSRLGQSMHNMLFVPTPDQFDKMHSAPLTKNLFTIKKDLVGDTFQYYGMNKKELVSTDPSYMYGGMKIRKYTSIKSWHINPQNSIRGPLVFTNKPSQYSGQSGAYFKATIKNKGASTIFVRPGDLLYYKGGNALCHVSRFDKKPIYELRWCFAVTSHKWMDENQGYPGSLNTEDKDNIRDYRNLSYDDIGYAIPAGQEIEISVRNELVHYNESSNQRRDTNANRDLALGTDEFWIFPSCDPNFIFNKGSFFFYNLDMNSVAYKNGSGSDAMSRMSEDYMKGMNIANFGPLRPKISLDFSGASTPKSDTMFIGINNFQYSDTLGDEFNYILPTQQVSHSITLTQELQEKKLQQQTLLQTSMVKDAVNTLLSHDGFKNEVIDQFKQNKKKQDEAKQK